MNRLRERVAALPRPRLNRKVLVRTWWALFVGWVIYTGPVAYADDPIEPTGAGSLIVLPDLSAGGGRLFYEDYITPNYYTIHNAAGITEPIQMALNAASNFVMFLIEMVAASAALLASWLFSLTTVEGMGDAVANMMGASATNALGWLFPSALAIGGIIAYLTRGGGGESLLNNFLWIIVAGSLMIGLATVPDKAITGVESVRGAGAELVGTMSQGISVNGETPINHPNPPDDELQGSSRDIAMRKSLDALWRTLVVTPWCLGEFGSVEACELYGDQILTSTGEDREKATEDAKRAQAGSGTVTWMEGTDLQMATQRLMVLVVGLIIAAVLCIVLIVIGLTAMFALVMSYLLLLVGPFFVCMWCISGAPRRWGNAWLHQLAVQILMSFIALLIFMGVLSLVAVLYDAAAAMGWAMMNMLAIVALIAAVALRGKLEAIFGIGGEGGSGLGKYMVARSAMRLLTRMPLPGGGRLPSRTPKADNSTTEEKPPPRQQSPAARSRAVVPRGGTRVGAARTPRQPTGPVDFGYVHSTRSGPREVTPSRRQIGGGRPQIGPSHPGPRPGGTGPRTGGPSEPARRPVTTGPSSRPATSRPGTTGPSRPAHRSVPQTTTTRTEPAPAPASTSSGARRTPVLEGEVVGRARPRPVTTFTRPGIPDAPQPRRTHVEPPVRTAPRARPVPRSQGGTRRTR